MIIKKEEFRKMKIEHIAITIIDEQEIENFYIDILGMTKIKKLYFK